MRKLLEVLLRAPTKPGVVVEAQLPFGTQIVKFGYKMEKSVIQAPGATGPTMDIRPSILCLGDPRESRLETHRFQMVMGSEDIPDEARYIDVVSLPNGATVHLFELGEPTPVLVEGTFCSPLA